MLFWQHFTEIKRFHLKPPFSEDQSGYRNCALFCAAKNSRIYEFLYSQRLSRHDFNDFCSMWNKNRLSQQNIWLLPIIWLAGQVVYIKPNFWICTDFVLSFVLSIISKDFSLQWKLRFTSDNALGVRSCTSYTHNESAVASHNTADIFLSDHLSRYSVWCKIGTEMPVLWFTYLSILPITIPFCQTKTTLSPLYCVSAVFYLLRRIDVDFHSLYA